MFVVKISFLHTFMKTPLPGFTEGMLFSAIPSPRDLCEALDAKAKALHPKTEWCHAAKQAVLDINEDSWPNFVAATREYRLGNTAEDGSILVKFERLSVTKVEN
jgi:hypothetical protein